MVFLDHRRIFGSKCEADANLSFFTLQDAVPAELILGNHFSYGNDLACFLKYFSSLGPECCNGIIGEEIIGKYSGFFYA